MSSESIECLQDDSLLINHWACIMLRVRRWVEHLVNIILKLVCTFEMSYLKCSMSIFLVLIPKICYKHCWQVLDIYKICLIKIFAVRIQDSYKSDIFFCCFMASFIFIAFCWVHAQPSLRSIDILNYPIIYIQWDYFSKLKAILSKLITIYIYSNNISSSDCFNCS